MSGRKAYRKTPRGWEACKTPTSEKQRSMDQQQARMFTPGGLSRMVIETRDKASKGLIKPGMGFVQSETERA